MCTDLSQLKAIGKPQDHVPQDVRLVFFAIKSLGRNHSPVYLQGYHRVYTIAWDLLDFNCVECPFAGRDQLGERDEEEVRKA
jgi:hypothetical protein